MTRPGHKLERKGDVFLLSSIHEEVIIEKRALSAQLRARQSGLFCCAFIRDFESVLTQTQNSKPISKLFWPFASLIKNSIKLFLHLMLSSSSL